MSHRKTDSIARRLKAAVQQAERRGITRYQIAKASGVSQAMLSRLVSSAPGRDVRIETAEKILGAIGLELVIRRPKARRPRNEDR